MTVEQKKIEKEADRIEVQHILVGFEGSLPGKKLDRTMDQARDLAEEILEKAQEGESFDELVKKHTDDQVPGIYAMSNNGVTPQGNEFPRGQMVAAFGDVGFQLEVGEVGLAQYDKEKSPFGFHIIKRVK